jgi:hypothetical protein
MGDAVIFLINLLFDECGIDDLCRHDMYLEKFLRN